MDEEPTVFEQLTLSDFKKWSSTALRTINNYTIIMPNNSEKIRIFVSVKCGVFVFATCLLVNSARCSGEFYVVWKHFQNLENLIFEIFEGKIAYLLPCGPFFP